MQQSEIDEKTVGRDTKPGGSQKIRSFSQGGDFIVWVVYLNY